MTTPTVTQIARRLEPVAGDPFIADLRGAGGPLPAPASGVRRSAPGARLRAG